MRWKYKYERDARRKYKWPVLQVLLQIAVMKLVLRKPTLSNKVLTQNTLQFIKLNGADKDDSCLFERCEELKVEEIDDEGEEEAPFEAAETVNTPNDVTLELLAPCLTPFTSGGTVGKIKALKIFALVKMELLKEVAPSR